MADNIRPFVHASLYEIQFTGSLWIYIAMLERQSNKMLIMVSVNKIYFWWNLILKLVYLITGVAARIQDEMVLF